MTFLKRNRTPHKDPPARHDTPAPALESLAEKLAREARTCGTCGFAIANPMTDRCPRCYALVPLSEHTNCGECSHQGNCEIVKLREMGMKSGG